MKIIMGLSFINIVSMEREKQLRFRLNIVEDSKSAHSTIINCGLILGLL